MPHFSASYLLWKWRDINKTGYASVVTMDAGVDFTNRWCSVVDIWSFIFQEDIRRASLATSSTLPSNAAYCQPFRYHLHLDSPNARWSRRQTPRLAIMLPPSRPLSPPEPTDAAASEASGEIHTHAVSRDIVNGSAFLQSCQRCRTWRLAAESVQSVWRLPPQASLP